MPLYHHKFTSEDVGYVPSGLTMPSGAVFYAPLNEASGTAATGQSLTTTGTVSFQSINGIPCAYFNGSSFIKFDASDFSYGQNFSVSFYVNCDITDRQRTAFSYGTDQANKAFAVMMYTNGRIKTIGSNDADNEWTSENNTISVNEWNFITVVNHVTYEDIFVNGLKIGSFTYTRNITSNTYGYIGSLLADPSTYTMIGYISSIRFYNRVLTDAEITTLSHEFVEKTEYQSSGFDDLGHPVPYRSAKLAKCNWNPIPQEGLIFYASLVEDSATATTGQALTTTGTVTYQTENGVPCAYFDGSSYISSSDRRDLTAIQSTNSFTISLWTKIPEAMSYARGLFMGGDGTSNPYGVYIDGNSGIVGELSASGGGYLSSAYGKYGTWAHICFIGNNGNASLLVDGVEVATKSYTSIGGSTSSSLLIGKRNTSCVYSYIAGVRVYSRALSASEIAQLANEFHPTNE